MFTWIRKLFDGSSTPPPLSSANGPNAAYSEMRRKALSIRREEVGGSYPPIQSPVWGALMETGYPHATATLFSLIGSETSLYLSTGGGILDGHAYEPVGKVASLFLGAANDLIPHFKPTSAYPVPSTDQILFYVLTDSGVLTAGATKRELVSGRHPLSPLFFAGHAVLTELRALVRLSTTY